MTLKGCRSKYGTMEREKISVRSNFVTAEGASLSHQAEGGVEKNFHAYMQEALDMAGVLGDQPHQASFQIR